MTALTEYHATEERTANSRQLVEHLAEEHDIHLSPGHLRRLLKKRYRWKRTRHSHRRRQELALRARQKANLEVLERAAQDGYIRLKYLSS